MQIRLDETIFIKDKSLPCMYSCLKIEAREFPKIRKNSFLVPNQEKKKNEWTTCIISFIGFRKPDVPDFRYKKISSSLQPKP